MVYFYGIRFFLLLIKGPGLLVAWLWRQIRDLLHELGVGHAPAAAVSIVVLLFTLGFVGIQLITG